MKIEKIIELYKLYRGKSYARISLYALIIPIGIFSPSIINIFFRIFASQYIITDFPNNELYGLISLAIILVFYIISYWIDVKHQPLNPYFSDKEKQKEQHDTFVVAKILQTYEYHYFKNNLESAINAITWDFIERLSEAEYYLNPQYKLYNSEVEKMRYVFLCEVDNFNGFLSMHLFPVKGDTDKYSLPKEWLRDGRRSKYLEHEQKIKDKSFDLFQLYEKFLETAKENMLVPPPNQLL